MLRSLKFFLKLFYLNTGKNRKYSKINNVHDGSKYPRKNVPVSITFSTTWHCNLNCIHCAAEINNQKEDKLNTNRFLELIDEIADAGVIKVGFTGGEPLMRKGMPEIIEKCKERNLITHLVTNGWLVHKYTEVLKKLDLLMISLDGDKSINDKIRGDGNWDIFFDAVRIAKDNNINVAGMTNINGANIEMFEKFPELFEELGIHWYVQMFDDIFGVGDNANKSKEERVSGSDLKVTQEQQNRVVKSIKDSQYLRTSRKYLEFMKGNHRPIDTCFAGIGYAVIDADGILYPCNPAMLDARYQGVSLLESRFSDGFDRLPLYRKTCDSCTLGCHIEPNYLFSLNPNSLVSAFKATKLPSK